MPELAVAASGAMLIAGGASIVLGMGPKLGTLAVIGFLAGVSPVMHDFWTAQDPGKRQNEMINFSKNMAMLGAAVALLGVDEPVASERSHRTGQHPGSRASFRA